jgi:hypothetical protein
MLAQLAGFDPSKQFSGDVVLVGVAGSAITSVPAAADGAHVIAGRMPRIMPRR